MIYDIIIQRLFTKIGDVGKITQETREVNLNSDDKRFLLGRLENITAY